MLKLGAGGILAAAAGPAWVGTAAVYGVGYFGFRALYKVCKDKNDIQ